MKSHWNLHLYTATPMVCHQWNNSGEMLSWSRRRRRRNGGTAILLLCGECELFISKSVSDTIWRRWPWICSSHSLQSSYNSSFHFLRPPPPSSSSGVQVGLFWIIKWFWRDTFNDHFSCYYFYKATDCCSRDILSPWISSLTSLILW